MRKSLVAIALYAACTLTGCGQPEPTVLDKDERQSLGELMSQEAEAAAAKEKNQ